VGVDRRSDRLVDSEIVKNPAFQGADGKFGETALRKRSSLSAACPMRWCANGLRQKVLMTRQVLDPGGPSAAKFPLASAMRCTAVLTETREGTIQVVPSAAFAPKEPPSQADLAAFYQTNASRYRRPGTPHDPLCHLR